MQDNKEYQQIVDRGWQKMSTLLDIEMPQARKRRRIAPWWFVAAGVMLSASAFGYYSWQNVQRKPIPELPIIEKSVETAATSQQQTDEVLSPKIKGESANSQMMERSTAKTIIASEPTIASLSNTTPSLESTKQNNSVSKGIQNADGDAEKEISANDVTTITSSVNSNAFATTDKTQNSAVKTSQEIETSALDQNNRQTVDENSEIVYSSNTMSETSASDLAVVRENISMAKLPTTRLGEIGEGWRSLIIPAASPKRDHNFSLEGLVATHLNTGGSPLYGVEAGLNTIVVSHKRLRVYTGLTYGYYNVDGLGIFSSHNRSDAENFGNNGGNPDSNSGYVPVLAVLDVVNGELEYSEAKQLTEKFHYIHLPIRVEYRITPRFSVMAGVKVSSLLAAPARYRLNDSRFSASPYDPVSASKGFLYNYGILRKFDVAPLVGMSYNIGERLTLDASYSHGVVHYINDASNSTNALDLTIDRSDFHRSASLGVRYRIL